MTTYVELAVNVPQASGLFHYHLPANLEGRVPLGALVEAPFGRQDVQGVVLGFVDEPQVPYTRPVTRLVDPEAVLTPAQIRLARWMSEHFLAPLAMCIDLMLPPGLSQRADVLYAPVHGRSEPAPRELPAMQADLLALLSRRGPLRGRQIDAAFPHHNWRPAASALERRGWITATSLLPPPEVRPKVVRTAQLAMPPEAVAAALPKLGRAASPAFNRRRAILDFLQREPWPVEVRWVYAETGGTSTDLERLAELGLIRLSESHIWRDPLSETEYLPAEPPELTPDQARVWADIRAALHLPAPKPILLHGVTGSGKTEIYLRAAAETLSRGKQAIVLVPEISLTPQTVRRFTARFPGRVGLMHSGLSAGENYDTWRRARRGELAVIVGARSALFAPLPDIGLIVVDECHDGSYYQDNLPPFYHAVGAAIAYAQFTGAACLLGSATPDVVHAYLARQGRWQLLGLPARILAHRQTVSHQLAQAGSARSVPVMDDRIAHLELPPVRLVDMRAELKSGNRSLFSAALLEALRQTLAAGQQAILFLNRRGTATYVFCRECGAILRCPRCELPLTYHTDAEGGRNSLVCHHCGYRRRMPTRCPQCGSSAIRRFGAGTERVEAEVQELLPGARTLRWDAETTQKKGAHEVILSHFANHRADVLIGTQMLAKGLDLPLVTLVGVVLADVGLSLPDYRAAERTFQVLTQVAGRAGRSPLGGQVILQTFQPEHYAIQAASRHDYEEFYRLELEQRRRLRYPPFFRLVRLEYRHREEERARAAAESLAANLRRWIVEGDRRATDLIGPAPCFYSRLNDLYRWQIVLRGPDPAGLLRGRDLGEWKIQVDPPSLL